MRPATVKGLRMRRRTDHAGAQADARAPLACNSDEHLGAVDDSEPARMVLLIEIV